MSDGCCINLNQIIFAEDVFGDQVEIPYLSSNETVHLQYAFVLSPNVTNQILGILAEVVFSNQSEKLKKFNPLLSLTHAGYRNRRDTLFRRKASHGNYCGQQILFSHHGNFEHILFGHGRDRVSN